MNKNYRRMSADELNDKQAIATQNYLYLASLLSGGMAGFVVDVLLFPIDTIKTRLQSEKKFWRSGGFRGIYNGLGPVALGSVPSAALFFCTYESMKRFLLPRTSDQQTHYVHMSSAAIAEIVACFIRVPVELAKQRRQVQNSKYHNSSATKILIQAYRTEGIRRGLYRGFGATIFREIPFSFIQYPLWEYLKMHWMEVTDLPLNFVSVAICGAIAGCVAAGLTTPLDVVKTRIMLASRTGERKMNITHIMIGVYKEGGIKGLFSGVVPRVLWITIGGAIFFGSYDLTSNSLNNHFFQNSKEV